MQSMARMNKKDSWLFWWTLYLTVSKDYLKCHIKSWKSKASQRKEWGFFERLNPSKSYLLICWTSVFLQAVAWTFLAIFSLIRFQADYLLVIGVCLTLSIANIVGFTRCRKGTLINCLNLSRTTFCYFLFNKHVRTGKNCCFASELHSSHSWFHDYIYIPIVPETYIFFLSLSPDAKKQLQAFATQTLASRVSSTIQSAFSVVWRWLIHDRMCNTSKKKILCIRRGL